VVTGHRDHLAIGNAIVVGELDILNLSVSAASGIIANFSVLVSLEALNRAGQGSRSVVGYPDSIPGSIAFPLLQYVRQLMRENPPSGFSVGTIFPGAKNNVPVQGKGASVNRRRRLRRSLISMHADAAEVLAEAWLHE
jgi:hypothetical protein